MFRPEAPDLPWKGARGLIMDYLNRAFISAQEPELTAVGNFTKIIGSIFSGP